MIIINQPQAEEQSSGSQSLLKIKKINDPIQYQLQTLNRHALTGLIPCHQKQQNGQTEIWHDISGLMTLPEYLNQCVFTPSDGESLIKAISEIVCRSVRHLLPPGQLNLTADHIYISKTVNSSSPIWTNRAGTVHLMFWPVHTKKIETPDEPLNQTDARQFAEDENIMVKETLSRLINDICGLFDIAQTRQEQLLRILHEQGISGLATPVRPEPGNPAGAQPDQAADQHKAIRLASCPSSAPQQVASLGKSGSQYMKSALAILLHLLLAGSAAAILTNLFVPGPVFRSLILSVTFLLLIWHLLLVFSATTKIKAAFMREQASNWLIQFHHQIKALNRPREQYDEAKAVDRMQQTLIMPSDPDSFRIATLTENPPGTPAEKDGLRVFILVEQFIIGRDQNKTDLCLSESAIGRQHARISRKGGSFFICDLGSKNGTRLDDQLLEKHQDTILPESCRLQFADHQFYFKAED